jgi:hypothetical protein
MNFELMTGYEFEEYIAKFFKVNGFEVQQTSYSHDGGIDLIAFCNDPIYSGKYIIQCKKYKDTLVGQPVIRDLYGVVMSENANKGILITTSDFTEDAQTFARHKNIELINGTMLARLIVADCNPPVTTEVVEGFNHERYRYLMDRIGDNPSDPKIYNETITFLRSYIIENAAFIEQLNLFDKIIDLNMQLIKKCYKKKADAAYRTLSWLRIAEMEMLKGNLGSATNILLENNRFFMTTWVPYHYSLLKPKMWDMDTNDCYIFEIALQNIETRNLYSILNKLGFDSVCKLILSKYHLENEVSNKKEHIIKWFKSTGNPGSDESDELIYAGIMNTYKNLFHAFISPQAKSYFIFSSPYVNSSAQISYPSNEKNIYEDTCSIVGRYKKTLDEIRKEIDLALKQHGIKI